MKLLQSREIIQFLFIIEPNANINLERLRLATRFLHKKIKKLIISIQYHN